MSDPFIAEIRMMPYTFTPRDWARCDGQLLSIAQFDTVFAVIGTTYGGDGRNTFGLPNLGGRTPMHWGQGPGLTNRALGQAVGTSTETLTEAQMPGHIHAVKADASPGESANPGGAYLAQGVGKAGPRVVNKNLYAPLSTSVNMANESVSLVGGGQAHDNRQPYLAVPFFIALQGIFPSRS